MRTISTERLARELDERPGLIPVGLNRARAQLIWCDTGEHRFTEPVFSDFLASIRTSGATFPLFASDLEALDRLTLPDNCLAPRGFIFHTGRCGSTLFSRALARIPQHMVLSEAPIHNDIWWLVTDDWQQTGHYADDDLARFRKLITLTGRRRNAESKYFVKFSSWQTVFMDTIRGLFPEVPCVLMFRDPAEILRSIDAAPPAWLAHKNTNFGAFCANVSRAEAQAMSTTDFIEAWLANLMQTALDGSKDDLSYVNYRDLTPEHFEDLVQACLDSEIENAQSALEQFDTHSKDVSGSRSFVKPAVDEQWQRSTPDALKVLFEQLNERAWRPTQR